MAFNRKDDDDHGSTRVGDDTSASGTHGDDDATAGTHERNAHRADTHDDVRGEHQPEHARDTTTTTTEERYEERVIPPKYKTAKTSVAAVFSLVFGLAALFCALTGILAPAAVLFGLIGIVLGVFGLKMAKRLGVTGKGVAIGGLVTAVLGLLLGAAVLAGAAVYVNDQGLDRIEQQLDDARANIPSGSEIRESVEDTVN